MIFHQQTITLKSQKRGFHLVTDEILSQIERLNEIKVGLAHIHILHTSAALSINENTDPDVRYDFDTFFTKLVPEDQSQYRHTLEGPDDMTSHIKSSLLGSSLTIPIRDGNPYLGTWQGIYLCEHRNNGGPRSIILTLAGSAVHK
ncbi:MAG: secondary thiamine-phosphate synthase enzyme YjbQ [Balneolales bacterium]